MFFCQVLVDHLVDSVLRPIRPKGIRVIPSVKEITNRKDMWDDFPNELVVSINLNGNINKQTISRAEEKNKKFELASLSGQGPNDDIKNKSQTVLIVDDNFASRKIIKDSLSQSYSIITADDGLDGLEKTKKLRPDLIITDIQMPRLDGIGLCERLKLSEETKHIPIIIITGVQSFFDFDFGLKIGADAQVSKPIVREEMAALVKVLLAKRMRLPGRFFLNNTSKGNSFDSSLSKNNSPLIRRVLETIERNIDNSDFSAPELEKELVMSHSTLYRVLRERFGLSGSSLIKKIRIQKAVELLSQGSFNISEVSYRVGFSDPLYFSKVFRKEKGVSPSEYVKQLRRK